jgi:hypothetical protein
VERSNVSMFERWTVRMGFLRMLVELVSVHGCDPPFVSNDDAEDS